MLSTKPLAGITVLEIGHSVAAPFAGMVLGELGADVVKLENPGTGDYARSWGPPFWGESSALFHTVNRGKRGIAVDLADPEDSALLRAFIHDKVDVVLHNLKFGALDKLGFGGARLVAEKPGLVFCNIGAFGAAGPLRDKPGYDPLMQAFSGIMSLLGEDGRPPVRVGVALVDMGAGMWSVIGILAALQERARTGQGGIVDTSLFETALGWLNIPFGAYLASGVVPRREGSGAAQIAPYQAFAASDGYFMLSAGNDNLFRRLCKAIGRMDLAEDPRFRTNPDRVKHRAALIPLLEAIFREGSLAKWGKLLDAEGIPNAPVQTLDQIAAHAQTAAVGMLQPSPDGTMRIIGLPLSFDGKRPQFETRAPGLAEHQDEVLNRK